MTRSLIARITDLQQQAKATDALPARDHSRGGHMIHERREALDLLDEAKAAIETERKEFGGLVSRVFELVTKATRGPNGHTWLIDLPLRENGSEFYQFMRSLAKWLAERTKAIR